MKNDYQAFLIKQEFKAARKLGHSAQSAISIARNQVRIAALSLPRYPADCVIRRDGVMFTIKIESDTDSTPFDWDCFYAEPEQAGRYQSDDRPGYTRIGGERNNYYYPRAEAIQEAIRQNPAWPRGTRFELAVQAVDKEIQYWHEWLNDSRYFIGVIVTAESADGFTADASLWGVEAGDSHGSWRDIAADLIAECAADIADQQQDRITALNDALEADFAGIEFCGF